MNSTTAEKSPDQSGEQGVNTELADFTEASYLRLLGISKQKYRFCGYLERPSAPHVIWRHDVDYSPHRALALAKLEAGLNLRCNYHILLASRYYNVFEHEITRILRTIVELGHEVGLHFDMDAFGDSAAVPEKEVEARISLEHGVLERLVGVPIRSMSYHNHTLNSARLLEREEICGMLNASASSLGRTYKYVSDSNGIWRHQRLVDVLQAETVPRLHVLTHPEWWTPEAMPPLDRLRRAVAGRARTNMQLYVQLLRRDGRLEAIGGRLGFSESDMDLATKPDTPV